MRSSIARSAPRTALVLACALALTAAAACGSGDKSAKPGGSLSALTAAAGTATALAPTSTPIPASTTVPAANFSSDAGTTGSGVLPLLFGDALGGTGAPGSLGEGDPAIKQYLLQPSELPSGFTVMETSTQQVHDGISATGTADVATMVAAEGVPGSGRAQILMSIAMHFSDLQDLDKAFAQVDSDALTTQLGGSGLPAGLFKDVKTLPTDGLGDHAAGFSLTMDVGQLFSGIFGALGDGGAGTPVALPSGVPTEMKMQMYVFARGSYVGAVMAVSYGSNDPGVNLLSLAKLADGRLAKAP